MTEPSPNPHVRPLSAADAAACAALHRSGIDTGFLSSLGRRFMVELYKAIPACRAGFGFVWEDAGQVLGFIACAVGTGRLYKQALWKRGLWMALPLMRFVVRPSVVRRMIQTLRYPSQVGDELPAAEVLSIAVSDQARGQGVGKALMAEALAEFGRRGVDRVKVAVGAANETANGFYRRCGFTLAQQREHHGQPMNIYVIEVSDAGRG